jgi:hypothetical protein
VTKWQTITYLASPTIADYAKTGKYHPAGRCIEKIFDGDWEAL